MKTGIIINTLTLLVFDLEVAHITRITGAPSPIKHYDITCSIGKY